VESSLPSTSLSDRVTPRTFNMFPACIKNLRWMTIFLRSSKPKVVLHWSAKSDAVQIAPVGYFDGSLK